MATEWVRTYVDGVEVDAYQVEIPDDVVNRRSIEAQAAIALANNAAYLAIRAPTQAQAIAQVEALTRQVNKLIRLVLNRLDDTE